MTEVEEFYVCSGCDKKIKINSKKNNIDINWHIFYDCKPIRLLKSHQSSWSFYRNYDYYYRGNGILSPEQIKERQDRINEMCKVDLNPEELQKVQDDLKTKNITANRNAMFQKTKENIRKWDLEIIKTNQQYDEKIRKLEHDMVKRRNKITKKLERKKAIQNKIISDLYYGNDFKDILGKTLVI